MSTQLEALTKASKWTMDDHAALFRKALESLEGGNAVAAAAKRAVMPADVKEAMEKLKGNITVLESFTQEERRDASKLNADAKARVARATGVPVWRIDQVVGEYLQLHAIHTWMRKRRMSGHAIPKNPEELQACLSSDPAVAIEIAKARMGPSANKPMSPGGLRAVLIRHNKH